MYSTLRERIATISYGNEYLYHNILEEFYPKNSSFYKVDSVNFAEYQKEADRDKPKVELAENPYEWFKDLKERNCKKLELGVDISETDVDDFREVIRGRVGEGWFIIAVFEDYHEIWSLGGVYNEKSSKYIHTYYRYKSISSSRNQAFDFQKAALRLKKSVEQLKNFTLELEEISWANSFQKTLSTIETLPKRCDIVYDDFLYQKNYNHENWLLLLATSQMFMIFSDYRYSWNELDLWVRPEGTYMRYLKYSKEAYEARNEAILASVNCDNG